MVRHKMLILARNILMVVGCVSLGSVAPDLEKLWNGFQRGLWHTEGYIIGLSVWGIGIVFICVGVCVAYFRRP